MTISQRLAAILFAGLLATSCANNTDKGIEDAEFHMDKAEYTEAIDILEGIVEAEPDNQLAKVRLATAYLGRGFFGDQSALGVFSDFLEGKADGKSNFETIRDVAPSAASGGQRDIFAASDLLDEVPAANRTEEYYLVQFFVHMAIITDVGVFQIEADRSDDPCDYNFDGVDDDEEARLDDSLDNVNSDAESAGIDDFSETSLGQQFSEMDQQLDDAGDVQTFLQNEYGAESCP